MKRFSQKLQNNCFIIDDQNGFFVQLYPPYALLIETRLE
jgi:hypothetical protein